MSIVIWVQTDIVGLPRVDDAIQAGQRVVVFPAGGTARLDRTDQAHAPVMI
jgi:hypothetical protein